MAECPVGMSPANFVSVEREGALAGRVGATAADRSQTRRLGVHASLDRQGLLDDLLGRALVGEVDLRLLGGGQHGRGRGVGDRRGWHGQCAMPPQSATARRRRRVDGVIYQTLSVRQREVRCCIPEDPEIVRTGPRGPTWRRGAAGRGRHTRCGGSGAEYALRGRGAAYALRGSRTPSTITAFGAPCRVARPLQDIAMQRSNNPARDAER